MEYEPIGKGVLVSFDAYWKNNLDRHSKTDISKLRKDFSNLAKRNMEQMHHNLYIEAFGAGDNSAAFSLYVEYKNVKLENLNGAVRGLHFQALEEYDRIERGTKLHFYELLSDGPWRGAVSVNNLKVRKVELEKVRQVYGQPEIAVRKK
jgi:hypothetical protein